MKVIGVLFKKLIIIVLDLASKNKTTDTKLKKSNTLEKFDYTVGKDIENLEITKGTNVEIMLFVNDCNIQKIEKYCNYSNLVVICLENQMKLKKYLNLRVIEKEEIKELIELYPIENMIYFDSITKEINVDDLSNKDYEFYQKIKNFFCIRITKEIIEEYNRRYIRYIKMYLENKNINLFLGTGISLDFSADSWNRLSDNLVDYLNPVYINDVNGVKKIIGNNNYSNTLLVKNIFPNYNKALYYCIYKKYTGIHSDNNTMRAVTSFISKYRNTNVITYNYDEFLEKDIRLGFKNFVAISTYDGGKYPTLDNKKNNESISKIEIKHVHGFIPYRENQWNSTMKKTIILNQLEYFSLYKSRSNWAYKIQYEALNKGVSLFVGSSLSDIFLVKILNDTKKTGKKYAFMYGENIKEKDKYNVIKYFRELNVFIIWCESFEKIYDLLTTI